MSVLKNLLLIAAACVVALALAEAGLRVAGVSYPSFYIEDPDLGGSLRPGAKGWWRGEGGAWVRINSDGMRDREYSLAKPPATLRIAVLGDSFAEALPVDEEKAFWAVAERELSRCAALAGRPVELLNFGVSGYGTAQELLMLRSRVWKYDPDIVLLAFFSGNDVRNNSRELNRVAGVPYFIYEGDRLVLDDSFRASLRAQNAGAGERRFRNLLAAVRNNSRLLQVADQARVSLHRRAEVQAAGAQDMATLEKTAVEGGELGIDNAVYAPPKDEAWEQAWRVTEGLILKMRDEVRKRGARFWVATLSTGIQVHPDAAVRQAFKNRLGVDSLDYPDRRVRSLAEREGIPVITLAPPMAAHAEKHQRFLHGFENAIPGFGHWNEEGNEVAGKLIAAELCASFSGE